MCRPLGRLTPVGGRGTIGVKKGQTDNGRYRALVESGGGGRGRPQGGPTPKNLKVLPRLFLVLLLLLLGGPSTSGAFICREDPLALLAGTLRTFQRHACDSTTLLLQCPKNTTIDVTYAHYGRPRPLPDLCPPLAHHAQTLPHTTCKFPGATDYTTLQRVVGQCQHRNDCKIQVAPAFFSDHDPCPLIRKYIEVAYKCRPEAFVNKVVCEDGNITLSCEPNSRVAVYSVLFGRSKEGSLSCPQPKGVAEEDCQASFATEMVMQRCHGYRTCHLKADASVYGRPCSKATKMYMKTVYTCVPRKILKSNYQGDIEDDEEPEAEEDQEANNLLRPGTTPVGSSDAPAVSPGTRWPPSRPKAGGGGVIVPSPAISPTKYPTHFDHPYRTSSPFFNPTLHPKGYKPTQDPPSAAPSSGVPGEAAHPPETDKPYGQRDGTPVRQPDLINCTVTILSGSQDTTIGFITEWMRAGSFIKRNYEKLILYLVVGLAAGVLVVMLVLVFRLLLDRRRTKKEAKMFNEPLTSVFAADIDEIDGDLDIMGNMGTSSSLAGGSPPPPPPSTASHEAISGRDVVRYNTTRPGIRRQDSDTNPRSLSRTNNNQLFYS
ncbi:uncharacterized protein LOC143037229 isoform X2 [Oratosquilla oratoria]|uniref:uncharacterized protein LOC143037229 isoform X2 n=1 Tax=Oratosquilla oratoria TaxID=337810 RepID=UPI003F758DDB